MVESMYRAHLESSVLQTPPKTTETTWVMKKPAACITYRIKAHLYQVVNSWVMSSYWYMTFAEGFGSVTLAVCGVFEKSR